MDAPRYGTPNVAYFSSWFQRDEPGGPMWALNLMKYKPRAEYIDGRETALTGREADDAYAPHGPLAAVGSKVLMAADVIHQLVGDGTAWDRIAIAQYRTRMAMVEMNQRADFQDLHAHKDAGMQSTIVMGTFPIEGDPVPDPSLSGTAHGRLLLLQVVADANAPDFADGIEAIRIGRFSIEGVMVGDERTWAEARYDLISQDTADALVAGTAITDDRSRYVIIAKPAIDAIAHSLSDPTQVLP